MEVLRIIDETLDAFFQLPIPTHPALLPDLMAGLDRCLQYYITKAKSGCGNYFEADKRCVDGLNFYRHLL